MAPFVYLLIHTCITMALNLPRHSDGSGSPFAAHTDLGKFANGAGPTVIMIVIRGPFVKTFTYPQFAA